ncbi:LPS translocon maturation chaperone LptM, partial [Staphylococcus aureus]
MLKASQILVRCIALGACAASLAACGQKGPLFLP